MKIRSDFVTNSSSSSFILSKNGIHANINMYEEIMDYLPDDFMSNNEMTTDDAMNLLRAIFKLMKSRCDDIIESYEINIENIKKKVKVRYGKKGAENPSRIAEFIEREVCRRLSLSTDDEEQSEISEEDTISTESDYWELDGEACDNFHTLYGIYPYDIEEVLTAIRYFDTTDVDEVIDAKIIKNEDEIDITSRFIITSCFSDNAEVRAIAHIFDEFRKNKRCDYCRFNKSKDEKHNCSNLIKDREGNLIPSACCYGDIAINGEDTAFPEFLSDILIDICDMDFRHM